MKQRLNFFLKVALGLMGILAIAHEASSQPFIYQQNDLLVGFRKTGSFQANYEVVVDISQPTNYTTLTVGTTVNVPNFTAAQLGDAFSTLKNLNWSVLGGDPSAIVPGYPSRTLWVTVPRTNAAIQSTAPSRLIKSAQQVTATEIVSILAGAASISSTIGTSNQDNTAKFVREPINDPSDLTAFIASQNDSTASTLHDSWPGNVEITSPSTFSSGVISDFYEVRPIGVLDPHTGLTNGPAYYLGYFQFNPDGTMTFTRGASTNVVTTPPAPEVLGVSRSANVSTIFFTTTNGATYTLYYTNASGLGAPVTTWAPLPTTIVGTGSPGSITDTTSDPLRFYRVGAR